MFGVRRTTTELLRRFQQPEYTGKNRCRPCTVVNGIIAVAVVAAVAVVSLTAATIAFVVCVTVIALRGYLVPGTPSLVRYLPPAVHELLGSAHATDEETLTDLESILLSSGIVVTCPNGDDLCLAEQYRDAWRSQMDELRETQRERLSQVLSVSPDEIAFEDTTSGWYVSVDGEQVGHWPSEAAFRADLASEALLEARLANWDTLPFGDRTHLLVVLRSFLETCPICQGDVVPDESVVESCCRDDLVSVTTACVDCGAVLFEGTHSSTRHGSSQE